jgi:hypothetical protein
MSVETKCGSFRCSEETLANVITEIEPVRLYDGKQSFMEQYKSVLSNMIFIQPSPSNQKAERAQKSRQKTRQP